MRASSSFGTPFGICRNFSVDTLSIPWYNVCRLDGDAIQPPREASTDRPVSRFPDENREVQMSTATAERGTYEVLTLEEYRAKFGDAGCAKRIASTVNAEETRKEYAQREDVKAKKKDMTEKRKADLELFYQEHPERRPR